MKRCTIEFDRFDLFDRDRLFREFEIQQAAQRSQAFGLVIDQLGIVLELLVIVRPAGHLQLIDGLRIEEMVLAVLAPLVHAANLQGASVHRAVREGMVMAHGSFARDHLDPHPADARRSSR